jgi:sensor domain CHASE-containing protein
LGAVESYVRIWEGVWPDAEEERGKVLRRILVENGQLFARWKVSPLLKEFSFELGPRE